MIKKIAVLMLIILAAYVMLPFGFGLWKESIGVRLQITFAESPSPSPERMPEDSASVPSEQTDADYDTASDSAQGEDVQETAEPETAVTDCPGNSSSAESVDSGDDETASPEAVVPFNASAGEENAAQVQPEAESASDT